MRSSILAVLMSLFLVAEAGIAVAQSSSRSSGLSSSRSRSSSNRSSRSSRADSYDDDDDEASSRSRSSSRSSRSSSRSSRSRSSRSRRSRSSAPKPMLPVLIDYSEGRPEWLRRQGSYLSVAAFESLRCEKHTITLESHTYHRCGDAWYDKFDYAGDSIYLEIFAPKGARVDRLPSDHEAVGSAGKIYYVTDNGLYEAAGDGGGYVAVDPSVGLRLDALPRSLKKSIPVVAGGVTYYNHLGRFFREEEEAGRTTYVACDDPF